MRRAAASRGSSSIPPRSSTGGSPRSSSPGSSTARSWCRDSCSTSSSTSPTARTRSAGTAGRRGLEILNRMQKEPGTPVEIVEDAVPSESEVDAKLVALARARSGVILTNDFNLNRVAELQGVRVMNINSLANAVKPAVLPGEELAGPRHPGRQGGRSGCRLPRRRDDDRGRGWRSAHRQGPRRLGHPRPPDRRWSDDLRAATARFLGLIACGIRPDGRRDRRRCRRLDADGRDRQAPRDRSAIDRCWRTRSARSRRARPSSRSSS